MPLPESYKKVTYRSQREHDWTVLHNQWHWDWFTPDELEIANEEFTHWLKKGVLLLIVSTDPEQNELPSQQEINAFVERTTEEYFSVFGSHMKSVNLYYLSNYLLRSYLGSDRKKKTDKCQILSRSQQRTRYSKEFSLDKNKMDAYHATYIHNIAKRKNTMEIKD